MKRMLSYIPIVFLLVTLTGCTQAAMKDGRWEGIVTVKDTRFFIHLKAENQSLFLSIPEMLATDIPAEDVRMKGDTLSFTIHIGTSTMRYLLTMGEQGLDGKILYDNASGTVMLREGRYTVEHRRLEQPQRTGTPVSIDTATGTLRGTHLTPDGEGPFPTVLIIAGSGPTDRDGNSELLVESNDNLWHLAHELKDAGIASIRYDKIGVGESIPAQDFTFEGATFDDFVDDAVRWLKYLSRDRSVSRVGIVGHSEGSLIGILAADMHRVDFLVSVAGNGDPIDEQMVKQISRIDEEAAMILAQRLEEVSRSEYRETGNLLVDSFIPLGRELYLQTWMSYDPTEELRKLNMPTLVIWGARDERLVAENDRFPQEGMPGNIEFKEIRDMGHMLRIARNDSDLQRSYKDHSIALHPQFIDTVVDFIRRQE
ncbi:MAG: alpha/beta hydrolase [Sphaerochaetaceae bacterium]|nr:alpha/beta hydrolase [Sphaerochaetaceae bacterium]